MGVGGGVGNGGLERRMLSRWYQIEVHSQIGNENVYIFFFFFFFKLTKNFSTSYDMERTVPFRGTVQELCESRGGRPGLSVLTSLRVSVDVKLY